MYSWQLAAGGTHRPSERASGGDNMDLGDRTLLQRSKSRRWVGNVKRMEEIRNANKIFVQKDLEERLLGRHWLRWINIKTKKNRNRMRSVDWINLAQDRGQ
jgi:hypothetical protein